jgi:hypothetical protein
MSNLKKLEITPCDPFNSSRLWSTEKYTLNNMLLHDVNFPSFFYQGDIVFSQYSDRIPYKDWQKLSDKYLSKGGFEDGGCFRILEDKDFLSFCRDACYFDKEIYGARIVRFTNLSTGYPLVRIDIYWRNPKNPMTYKERDRKILHGYGDKWCNINFLMKRSK